MSSPPFLDLNTTAPFLSLSTSMASQEYGEEEGIPMLMAVPSFSSISSEASINDSWATDNINNISIINNITGSSSSSSSSRPFPMTTVTSGLSKESIPVLFKVILQLAHEGKIYWAGKEAETIELQDLLVKRLGEHGIVTDRVTVVNKTNAMLDFMERKAKDVNESSLGIVDRQIYAAMKLRCQWKSNCEAERMRTKKNVILGDITTTTTTTTKKKRKSIDGASVASKDSSSGKNAQSSVQQSRAMPLSSSSSHHSESVSEDSQPQASQKQNDTDRAAYEKRRRLLDSVISSSAEHRKKVIEDMVVNFRQVRTRVGKYAEEREENSKQEVNTMNELQKQIQYLTQNQQELCVAISKLQSTLNQVLARTR